MSRAYIPHEEPSEQEIQRRKIAVAAERGREHTLYEPGQLVTYTDPHTRERCRATVIRSVPGAACSIITIKIEGREGERRVPGSRVEVRR